MSFNQGVFPNILKIPYIIPIHKKGGKFNCNNCRSISQFQDFWKIYAHFSSKLFQEKYSLFLLSIWLLKWIFNFNHALTSLTELIRKALDEDKFACGVFIDLQKVFDSVDRNILLSKLYHYSVKGPPHQWLKSYITGREQYTTINHQNPSLSNIKYGSLLGPLLFLLYISHLNKAILLSKVHHFPDDTNFLYAIYFLKNLNKTVSYDLSNLVQWLRVNKISLDVNKSEIAVFRSPT